MCIFLRFLLIFWEERIRPIYRDQGSYPLRGLSLGGTGPFLLPTHYLPVQTSVTAVMVHGHLSLLRFMLP